jgi:hypothetical protein
MEEDPGTPAGRPSADEDDAARTVLRPAPSRENDGDGTTYRPRTTPPTASDEGAATHFAPRSTGPFPTDPGATGRPTSLPPVASVADVPHAQAGRPRFRAPEQRFVAPAPQPPRQPRGVPVRAIVAWALAVIMVGVGAGFVYVRWFRHTQDDLATRVPENSASAKVKVLRGDEVVRRYLDALAAGDPDTALGLAQSTGTGSGRVVTKRAYAVSLREAPITDIDVPRAPDNATEIPASYVLGGTRVATSYRVVKQDNGSWLLNKATVTFRPVGTGVDHLPLLVNGVSVNWENAMELLPGRYVMSTGLTYLAYPAGNTLTVPHLNYPDSSDHQITPTLTAAGRSAFIEAARRSLDVCVSRHELSPANCPFSVESAPGLVPDSPRWSIDSDTIGAANPALSASDQSVAQVTVNLNLRLRTQYRGGGTSNQPVMVNATVSGAMTGSSSTGIRLEWRIN